MNLRPERRSIPGGEVPVRSGGEPTPEEFLATAEASRRGFFAARLLRLPGLLVGGALLVFFFGLAGIAVLSFGSGLGHLPGSFSIGSMIPPPGPSWAHPFGYMAGNGVDILPALEQSTPWDIALVGTPILLALLIGLVLGGLAATGNVAVDAGLTFVTDVLVGVPPWILVIVFFLALQPVVLPADSLLLFGTISTLVLWPYYARPIRARAKAVAVEPYVEAARASGAQRGRLLSRHILPNSLAPAFAQVPVDVFNLFFVLTAFPFLGCFNGAAFGYVSPLPATVFPEWGYLLANGACFGFSFLPALNYWWMYLFPLGAIVLFSLAVTFTCDGLLHWYDAGRAT